MPFPHLDNFIGAYLNQDYAYYADTVEGVIDVYRAEFDRADIDTLRQEIAHFIREHPDDLDEAFHAAYWYDFDPTLWNMTTRQFLDLLDARLRM